MGAWREGGINQPHVSRFAELERDTRVTFKPSRLSNWRDDRRIIRGKSLSSPQEFDVPAPHSPIRRFLVTAGNTRERIDQVRDWGNIFTGGTGLRIARALAEIGEVDLLTSNRQHLAEIAESQSEGRRIHGAAFTTHAELRAALAATMTEHTYDAVVMTAAVADYTPAGVFEVVERRGGGAAGEETWVLRNVQAGKVKSSYGQIAIAGTRTEKLVDLFRTEWRHRGLLIKFKLEVGIGRDELLRIGEASRRASSADYLVANTLDMVDGAQAGAFLLSNAGYEWVPRAELPARIAAIVANGNDLSRP